MLIRRFKPNDAVALADLFHAAVQQTAAQDYTAEQIAAWSPHTPNPARYVEKASDGRIFLVAINGAGEPIAYGDLELDGHLDHFYCRPDVTGKGIASALYDVLERTAIEVGLTRIYVEASETARALFKHKGFSIETRQDFSIQGVAIHNYLMSKNI